MHTGMNVLGANNSQIVQKTQFTKYFKKHSINKCISRKYSSEKESIVSSHESKRVQQHINPNILST